MIAVYLGILIFLVVVALVVYENLWAGRS